MSRSTVAGLLILLGGCTDNRAASTIPTSTPAARQWNAGSETRFGSDARGSTWSSLSDAEKQIAERTTARAAQELGDVHLQPQIVLLDRALPDGAVAFVLRNPNAPAEPIIIVQSRTLDARTMERAFSALESMRRSHRVQTVRTLSINALGEITALPTDLAARVRVSNLSGTVRHTGLGAQLVRSAASTAAIDIPGLGSGTVLRFR